MEIKKDGMKTRDGYFSMPPLTENVEYIFYAVAETTTGKFSDVVSKRAASSTSRGIEIRGHVYCKLQIRDEIDDYTNEIGTISINTGKGKKAKKIEYIIADKFVNSAGMIEQIATAEQDVTTAAGTSSMKISTWAEYDPNEKPGLVRDMLNYVYVKITDEDDCVTYYSSCGIWEDETLPTAVSVTAEESETSAVVTVTGSDEESGIERYYLLLQDPIDLMTVVSEDVRKNGMASDDGNFELTGLSERTRYDLYAVVEDKAGNLSEVRSGDMTTAGEQKASSVRPGSESSSNPGSSSNIEKHTKDVSLEDPEVVQKVEERIPYLVGSEGKAVTGLQMISGWDNIKVVAEKKAEPGDIYVSMNGGAVVPGDVLEKVAGRNISFHFFMDDDFTWVVSGRSIPVTITSVDFRVSLGSVHIPTKLINDLAGVYPRQTFTVEHNGTFGFPLALDLQLGSENEGKTATLYYYSVKDNRLEQVANAEIDYRGRAVFSMPDESDFVVIVGPSSGEEIQPDASPDQNKTIDDSYDKFKNTSKGSSKVWIICCTIIAVLLCIYIIFMPQKKVKEEEISDE